MCVLPEGLMMAMDAFIIHVIELASKLSWKELVLFVLIVITIYRRRLSSNDGYRSPSNKKPTITTPRKELVKDQLRPLMMKGLRMLGILIHSYNTIIQLYTHTLIHSHTYTPIHSYTHTLTHVPIHTTEIGTN